MAYKPFDLDFGPEPGFRTATQRVSGPGGSGAGSKPSDIAANGYFAASVMRAIDVVIALAALLVFLPLMAIVAVLIRATSGGPVLFRQRRLGQYGQIFICYKFRTMHQNADLLLSKLLAECAHSRAEWQRDQKLRRDPRVIKIGAFLRKASLDELPQLFNVLKGDMSIVGPRPIVPSEAEKYGRYIDHYFAVRPGITGLWQVSGRNGTSYRRRVACDVLYSRYQSPTTNIGIILRTIPVVLGADGAF